MRALSIPLLLLAVAACSRSHAPAPASGSALPPPPDAAIAQSVPAGGAPAPNGSVAAAASGGDAAAAKVEEALAPPDKSDARWHDVDPNTLGGRNEAQLAQFLAEQRKRDAELMQHDAAEAKERVASGGEQDRGDGREDPRAYADERYADERYADPREDRDDRYFDERERLPPNPRYGEPPYDEGEDEDYPPPDEDYDPRYDPRGR